MLDAHFVAVAKAAFNPFVPESGTEHVAPLLYSIIRMVKPRTIVEYGSGYTTLFILAALAENAHDFVEESEELEAKTIAAASRSKVGSPELRSDVRQWYRDGGMACGVDPGYYLHNYVPHLYCFDDLDKEGEYVHRMTRAVSQLKLDGFFSYLLGTQVSADILPPEAYPVDLAWNDARHYKEFFDVFWSKLNAKGGMMMFHNTAADPTWWAAITSMREERFSARDLEVLTLPEPHKLSQNSCTILRRTTEYQPSFMTASQERLLADLKDFVAVRRSATERVEG